MVQVWNAYSKFLHINQNPAHSVADHYSFQIFVDIVHCILDHPLVNHGHCLLYVYLNEVVGLERMMREYRSPNLGFAADDTGRKLWVGEYNNFHCCVAHHAIMYFPIVIPINYSANLNM